MKNRILSLLLAMTMIISLISFVPLHSKADYIALEAEVKSALSESGAFYPGSSKAVSDFGIINMPGKAFMENGTLYIPLDSADYIFLTMHESISGKTFINGKDVTSWVKKVNGVDFIEINAYANVAGLTVFDDELTDLYIMSKNTVSYNWRTNRKILSGIIGQMLFEFPTAEKIVSDISARFESGEHPRIMATEATFDRIKKETGIIEDESYEPVKAEWLKTIKSKANSYANVAPVTYGPTDHIRMRQQSGQVWAVGGYNAFMYKLTGEEKYAERAWLEVSTICADTFPDWNPVHLLDCGQMMNGMAITYDWLYDWMTPEQRTLMRRNIVDKGLTVMCDIFDGKTVYSSWRKEGRSYDFHSGVSNWNFVCCGGALMSALAIFDECEGEDRAKCERVLEECTKILYYSATRFSPSGDWYEGPAYARLSCETMTEACAALASCAGTDYGIMDAPGVSKTSEAPLALTGEYSFNISNAEASKPGDLPNTREFFYHATRFNRDDFAKAQFVLMDEYGVEPDFRDLIYCNHRFESADMELETDYYLKDSEIVTMRNADVDEGLIFAGLHGGENQPAQGHLDIGQFVIDSFGDRFAEDLGSENYNLLVDYYTKYRNRAEGHNTIVINPDSRVYDQTLDAVGVMTRVEHNEASSIAVLDMTSAYEGYASSATRAMKFINDRTSILLKDEIRGIAKKSSGENELYWFMHTKANITLLDNNKVAELDIDGNKMYVTLLTDGEFGTMGAVPLPNSPNPAGQNANNGYSKLFVHLTNLTDADIAVCFTPGMYYEDVSLPALTPIANWTLDNIEAETEGPKLSSISVNGEAIADFAPDVYHYEYKTASSSVPTIEAVGDGSVNVEYPVSLPGTAKITLTKSGTKSIYTVYIIEEKNKFEKASYKKLNVTGVYSSLDNAANTTDNNSETSLILNTGDSVIFELSEKSLANYVSLTGSKADFKLYYSNDGTEFVEVATLSGTDLAYSFTPDEYAKFIKLVSQSDNCEIKEYSAYGFDGFEYETEIPSGTTLDFITALYEVGKYQSERPLTFDGFQIPEGTNAMPEGLSGKWVYGYTSGSKLPIVAVEPTGKNGSALRFMAPQKIDTDTNGDGKIDNNDSPKEGFESIANNDCQYPRLKFYPSSLNHEKYEISFSVNFNKSHVFQLLSSADSTPLFYSYNGTVKCLGQTFDISTKDDSSSWYDFKLVMDTASGEYEATFTKCDDTSVTSTVSGTSELITKIFANSGTYFWFQQNSYAYAYHEVLLDNLYFGKFPIEQINQKDAPVLKYVRVQTLNLNDNVTLHDMINIPDDGTMYKASVFLWAGGNIVPVIKMGFVE